MHINATFIVEYHLQRIHHHQARNISGRYLFLLVDLDDQVVPVLHFPHYFLLDQVALVDRWALGFLAAHLVLDFHLAQVIQVVLN